MHPSTNVCGPNNQHVFVYDLEHPDRPPEYLDAVSGAERIERDPTRWAYELPLSDHEKLLRELEAVA
jgi:hypothetical protein